MSGRTAASGGAPPPRRAPRAPRLRAGDVADAPALARVMRAAIRGQGAAAYGHSEVRAWSSLPALYHRWAMTAGGERYVVAERDGAIVGYAARRDAELTAVFVLPRAAGAGVGTALVRHVERAARRAGVARLRVVAALGAVPFYARLGFGRRGAARVPLPGETSLAAVRMEKRLDSTAGAPGERSARRAARSSGRARVRPRGR
ncbi:GNAT family N-acetyltransferase [Anaeromyxobacter sp. Fw109-5]|uniref:GNAT family N-acetyltransferase n=1 Tax=Anaeromyxobacter sp. (strain Fw109-5) TaxID=404589 RepID=UPI0000ED7B04|nr:GNAT family N-acetyltransferase [Anaeromyxobacter sp. Fw109-5]ABS24327.1 GCN5-related N-acetyltransferase [Anaeromyxobacter sp. Fw109-5]